MIFSLDNPRKDGVDLSKARSEKEILSEADQKYSNTAGRAFEQIISRGTPQDLISISDHFLSDLHDTLVLDVRSPAEFSESHLPGAINFPILDNYERREVGILYKERGKNIATQKALDLAISKTEELKKLVSSYSNTLVYCWRGGGRSAYVFGCLLDLGFVNIKRLRGGYKAYRRWVHSSLYEQEYPPLIVVKGLTGVGKSELLRSVQSSFRVLDLEYCARHCASSFGSIPYELNNNYEIPSQKCFEDRIFSQLFLNNIPIASSGILVESESRKVGHRKVPPALYNAMLHSQTIEVTASLESRVNRIYAEYVGSDSSGIALLKRDLEKIKRYLSSDLYLKMKTDLENDQIREFIADCLIHYYDHRYAGYFEQKNILSIDNSISKIGQAQLLEFLKSESN